VQTRDCTPQKKKQMDSGVKQHVPRSKINDIKHKQHTRPLATLRWRSVQPSVGHYCSVSPQRSQVRKYNTCPMCYNMYSDLTRHPGSVWYLLMCSHISLWNGAKQISSINLAESISHIQSKKRFKWYWDDKAKAKTFDHKLWFAYLNQNKAMPNGFASFVAAGKTSHSKYHSIWTSFGNGNTRG
jgi:hypothetical protein